MAFNTESEPENMEIEIFEDVSEIKSKKRKSKIDPADEIEIDLNAPEPLSKKALRKAKKLKKSASTDDLKGDEKEDPQPNVESTPSANQNAEEAINGDVETAKESSLAKTRSPYGVWIGNIAFTSTKDELRSWILEQTSLSGSDITRVHMPGPQRQQQQAAGPKRAIVNRGFAYVDLSTEAAMTEVIELSESLLLGRALLIKSSKNFEGRPEQTEESKKPAVPASNTIFIGNLGFEATAEELDELYAQCGDITRIHVATFEDTGRCKGFAWVEFADVEAAKAAQRGWTFVADESDDEDDVAKPKKKQKTKKVYVNRLHGRQLRTEFAEDKTTRYNKRFGKDAKSRQNKEWDAEGSNAEKEPISAEADKSAEKKRGSTDFVPRSKPALKAYNGKEGVVQKMTGGIIKSEGKKVVFD